MATVRINRAEFLQSLEAVEPGLSKRDIVEQSSCFVLQGGEVMTYNDEISCRSASGLPEDFSGAVTAAPLLAILRKLPEDEVALELGENELLIIGKGRRVGITMESEISLPIDALEQPTDWIAMPVDFNDAISIVQECAGKDAQEFGWTCLHIHPKYIEACDNLQATRYNINTGIKEPILVRRDSIKHIVPLGMTEYSETKSWMHFRNPSGLSLSCKRFVEDYPDLSGILEVDNGIPASLPKGLVTATECAEIFSAENADNNQVLVELRPGKLRVKGQGMSGWFAEIKKLQYDGLPMAFLITPKLLMELTKRHTKCEIGLQDGKPNKLCVNGGKFAYVASLGDAGDE